MDSFDADLLRSELQQRLEDEGRADLADKLSACGEPLQIRCTGCGAIHDVHTRCRRKWCPACLRLVAARRTSRVREAVARMEWPLFLTLTIPNSPDPESVKELRAAFGRLRARKLWKERVRGGVAALEVTNRGRGWHPHLHAVIDCRWLSVTIPAPAPSDSAQRAQEKAQWAKRELQETWGAIVGHSAPVVHVKRARGSTITEEVLKYSVKGSDLVNSEEPVGSLIDVIEATRLVTTFGSLYGLAAELKKQDPGGAACRNCQTRGQLVPVAFLDLRPGRFSAD